MLGRYAEAGHLEALQQERHICRAKRFFDVTPQGLKVIEMVDGMTLPELTKLSGVPLTMAAQRAAA